MLVYANCAVCASTCPTVWGQYPPVSSQYPVASPREGEIVNAPEEARVPCCTSECMDAYIKVSTLNGAIVHGRSRRQWLNGQLVADAALVGVSRNAMRVVFVV